MFLNKGGRESGALKVPKMYVFRIKIWLFRWKKKQTNHSFSVSTIIDIEDSILDTVRYCEKVRDLDFRSLLDTIFSRLTPTFMFDGYPSSVRLCDCLTSSLQSILGENSLHWISYFIKVLWWNTRFNSNIYENLYFLCEYISNGKKVDI